MSEKVLVLLRRRNRLWIYDEEGDRLRNPIVLDHVTHVKRDPMGWYDIFNKKRSLGFVSNVKEVQEEW